MRGYVDCCEGEVHQVAKVPLVDGLGGVEALGRVEGIHKSCYGGLSGVRGTLVHVMGRYDDQLGVGFMP